MNPFKRWISSLSQHAVQRLAERTSLSVKEFLALLDGNKSVPVGIEARTNRLHRLIYSPVDKDYFVAIQDMANGEVITVLTLEFHENLAWPVSERSLEVARYMIEKHHFLRTGATHLKLRAVVRTDPLDALSAVKIKNLGTIPLASIDQPLESLDGNLAFCTEVRTRLTSKGIDPCAVLRVIGHVGKKPTPESLFEYGIDFLASLPAMEDSA